MVRRLLCGFCVDSVPLDKWRHSYIHVLEEEEDGGGDGDDITPH